MDNLPSVNRVVKDLSFQQDAFETLPYDQRAKTNLVRILLTLTNRWNNLQLLCIDLINGTLLDRANGRQLDGIARRLNIERGTSTDEQLRGLIKLHAVRQTNNGTRNEIVNIIRVLTGTDYVKIVKSENNLVEVTFSYECLDAQTSKQEVENLFPVNTNLIVMDKVTGFDPMGFVDVNDAASSTKIGMFSSVSDSLGDQYDNNVMPVVIIDNGAGI